MLDPDCVGDRVWLAILVYDFRRHERFPRLSRVCLDFPVNLRHDVEIVDAVS